MNRWEAERLLGGHAAGILTEAERRILFEAALAHQEVFDALMDEEALRELLADPETRARLLAQLETPTRPLWRRPAILSLAASLFLALTTSVMLLRNPRAALQPLAADKEPAPQAKAAPAPGAAETSAQAPALAAAPEPSKAKPATRAKALPAPANTTPTREALRPAAPPAPAQAADQARLEEAPSKGALAAQAEAKAEAFAPAAGAAPAPQARIMAAAKRSVTFRPVLEALPEGRYRLTVAWGPGGQLYVVKRHAGGAEVLKPLRTTGDGMLTSLFEVSLEPQDTLDVYRLEAPAADPASLPASSAVPGEWRRVFPGKP